MDKMRELTMPLPWERADWSDKGRKIMAGKWMRAYFSRLGKTDQVKLCTMSINDAARKL